jgi:hypothetical protein
MAGEQVTDENTGDRAASWEAALAAADHRLRRAVRMNIVLAIAVLTGLFMVKHQKIAEAEMQAVIGSVLPDSPPPRPAYRAATASSSWTAGAAPPGRTSA